MVTCVSLTAQPACRLTLSRALSPAGVASCFAPLRARFAPASHSPPACWQPEAPLRLRLDYVPASAKLAVGVGLAPRGGGPEPGPSGQPDGLAGGAFQETFHIQRHHPGLLGARFLARVLVSGATRWHRGGVVPGPRAPGSCLSWRLCVGPHR